MNFTRDDKEVFKAFMEQREMKSRFLRTDGQSLFSSDTRIAEHYPHDDGSASTVVYDFTDRGQAFIDKHIQWHVIQVKANGSPSKRGSRSVGPESRLG